MCVGTEFEITHVAGKPEGDVQKCSECGAVLADHSKAHAGPDVTFFRSGAKVNVFIPILNDARIMLPLIRELR